MIIPCITRKNHQDIKSEKVIDPFDEKIIDIMCEWGTLSDRLHRLKQLRGSNLISVKAIQTILMLEVMGVLIFKFPSKCK